MLTQKRMHFCEKNRNQDSLNWRNCSSGPGAAGRQATRKFSQKALLFTMLLFGPAILRKRTTRNRPNRPNWFRVFDDKDKHLL